MKKMKKMKKTAKRILFCVMCGILVMSVFTGCGQKATDKDEQGRTVITVGGWPDKQSAKLEALETRRAEFEKNNPDVVIQPDYWKFDLKTFYAKAAGGQLPTVYDTNFTEVVAIIESEYGADITDALKKRGFGGMFNEKILEQISKDGKTYAFPYATYVLGLSYNTQLFEQAGLMEADGTPKQPKDWNEVAEFAVKIKEATGKPGMIINTSGNAGGWIFTNIAWSFGVDFMEKDADGKWKATFNTQEAAEALQWIKDLKWKYDAIPSNTIVDNNEAWKLLGTGSGGMFITAGDIHKKVAQYGMNPDHLGIMAMPAGPKRHVTLLGGSIYAVAENSTEAQLDAAVRWIESAYDHKASDEYKANKERDIKVQLEEGQLVGIKGMSIWSDESESYKFESDLIDRYANSNPNHVRLYNEFVANCPAEIQPEEPVCAQELYQTLDKCIQEVLVNENADCAEVIAKANADFQSNYLDNLTY